MSGISHPVARTLPPIKRDFQPRSNAYHTNFRPREMHFNEIYNPHEAQLYDTTPLEHEESYTNLYMPENYQDQIMTPSNDYPPQQLQFHEEIYTRPTDSPVNQQNFYPAQKKDGPE